MTNYTQGSILKAYPFFWDFPIVSIYFTVTNIHAYAIFWQNKLDMFSHLEWLNISISRQSKNLIN